MEFRGQRIKPGSIFMNCDCGYCWYTVAKRRFTDCPRCGKVLIVKKELNLW